MAKTNGWKWVPSLYFAEGLPYVAVMSMAVIMYKNLQLTNTQIALYTGWMYLPWVIKPIWSPFVDIIKTKRFWVVAMQTLIAVAFAGIAFTLNCTSFVRWTLAFLWLMAFSSATHDIAADGFYMLGLESGDQSFFVGVRNTFYRIAMVFAQGVLVMLAGLLAEGKILKATSVDFATAWSVVFVILFVLFLALAIYHFIMLPKPDSDRHEHKEGGMVLKNFCMTFVEFFKKKDVGLALLFILTYRLGESQLVKIASPFLLDGFENGGMNLHTSSVGFIYGTVGVVALLLGGILGGLAISRGGLKKWIIPMVCAMNVPDFLYFILAQFNHGGTFLATCFVALEQLGYGFGFTAFTMYLIHFADGQYKTSHYSLCTGFMALGMMLPGMVSGAIQSAIGYSMFFIWVCVCTIPGFLLAFRVRSRLSDDYGKR